MTRRIRMAALLAAHLVYVGAIGMGAGAAPALAMQVLDAADHAELEAEISAAGVSRIALSGDRIARVVRAPGGFAVEHDAASGDLYLRPVAPAAPGAPAGNPVTLFIGTERGFTYRLTLTPADRDSAQILIRNPDAAATVSAGKADAGDPRIGSLPRTRSGVRGRPRVAALVRLVRAVARRELLPGYGIVAGTGPSPAGLRLIETWRGPRFAAHVFEADGATPQAAGLAGTIAAGPGFARVAAVWLAAPGTGPSGGRLAVAVTEAGGGAR